MKEEQERTPLRAILQNFLNHIEKLDSEEVEGSYDKEFQELKLFSEILKSSKQFSCSQGEKEVNRKKNRYKDILPFDESRVILEGYAGVPGSDYINANFIKGASGSPAYIASQAPLPHTVNDFWRMVVQCEVQVIVMACNEEEAGKHKCENYWVEHEGEERQFGMVAIRLIKASVVCPDFLVRTMRLKYTNSQSSVEERTVCQFHYSAWPDHGVPSLVRPLLDMVRLVRDTQASETLPVLVHCSAGCGRTGTICAIDYVWGLLRAGKLTKDFSLFKLVRDMRRQRIAMVQTKEQYILVHRAVKELFCEQLRMIDSHPYENIDVNGMPLVKEISEPMYATVAHENGNEEKQDSKEKEDSLKERTSPSPVSNRKKHHIASSKHEKEVENLTEKQRSIVEQSTSGDNVGSLLQKPRIAKLKALFERAPANRENRNVNPKQRTPQQVTRSHSLGAVRKVENVNQPIPCKGILKVPQLSTVEGPPICSSRPAVPIKRSKSLKVLGSGECYKLSVASYDDTTPCKDTDLVNLSDVGCERINSKRLDATSLDKDNGDVLVKNKPQSEPKPCIPPKKLTKDKIRDIKPAPNTGELKVQTKPYLDSGPLPKRTCEKSQAPLTVSALHSRRRRSLESFTVDDLSSIPPGNIGRTQAVHNNSPGKSMCGHAIQDSISHVQSPEKTSISAVEKKVGCSTSDTERTELQQNLSVEAQKRINAIVAGLGIRERRNSFRQAINTSKDATVTRLGGNGREYEAIWISGNTPPKLGDHSNSSRLSSTVGLSTANANCQVKGSPVINGNSLGYNSFNALHQSSFRGIQRKPHPSKPGIELVRAKSDMQYVRSPSGNSTLGNARGTHVARYSKEAEFNLCKQNITGKQHPQPKFNQETRNTVLTVKPEKTAAIPKSRPSMWPLVQSNMRIDAAGITTSGSPRDKCETKDHKEDSRKCVTTLTKAKNYADCPVDRAIVSLGAVPAQRTSKCLREPDDKVASYRKPELYERDRLISPDSRMDRKVASRSTNIPPPEKVANDCISIPQNFKTTSSSSSAGQMCMTSSDKKIGVPSSSPHQSSNFTSQVKSSSERTREETRKRPVLQDRGIPSVIHRRNVGTAKVTSTAATAHNASETDVVSYGLVAGVQLRRGSRDDLALCSSGPAVPPRVRRHASVVLLRHSLIETSDGTPIAPLTVWNASQQGEITNKGLSSHQPPSWSGASGVDLDTVARNIKSQPEEHNAAVMRTLEALHLRKSSPRSGPAMMSPPQAAYTPQQSTPTKKQHYL